jgi:transcription antitermination protein NusB
MMLRKETRRRARALQLLYTMDAERAPEFKNAAAGLARLTGLESGVTEEAEALAEAVLAHREELDRQVSGAADNWRIERVAVIERNILRLGIHELMAGTLPAKVVIDESLWLAHRFAGPKAPPFINGVLDRVARDLGRL